MPGKSISEIGAHLGFWLRFVSNHVSLAFARKLEGRGVTVAEWAALRTLYDHEALAPSQVAERMGMTRGAITKLVDRLSAKGLLVRNPDAADGRAQALCLTAKGRRLVPELAALADRNDAEFFAQLSAKERAALMRLMQAIVAHHGLKALPVD